MKVVTRCNAIRFVFHYQKETFGYEAEEAGRHQAVVII